MCSGCIGMVGGLILDKGQVVRCQGPGRGKAGKGAQQGEDTSRYEPGADQELTRNWEESSGAPSPSAPRDSFSFVR